MKKYYPSPPVPTLFVRFSAVEADFLVHAIDFR
jgi:hypothetical protein